MSDLVHHHVADGIRHIKVLRSGKGSILEGTETWAAPAKVDLLMHDIFHHHPTDDGSMVCELMSYGTQLWIKHHRDELRLGIYFDQDERQAPGFSPGSSEAACGLKHFLQERAYP